MRIRLMYVLRTQVENWLHKYQMKFASIEAQGRIDTSHGLGEENLGWYGCIVHFLRVQGYIPECTGTDKPMLNFTHSVRTHCLSMIRNEKQWHISQSQRRINFCGYFPLFMSVSTFLARAPNSPKRISQRLGNRRFPERWGRIWGWIPELFDS